MTNVATHPQAVHPPVDFGNVEGRVLARGKPLPNCKVKLVRMETSRLLLIRSVKYGIEFHTTTDKQGRYRFNHIPVGDYKLKWLTPGATSWIRRIADKPDVTVLKGRTVTLKDLETSIPTID